jgi:hypothetical protein
MLKIKNTSIADKILSTEERASVIDDIAMQLAEYGAITQQSRDEDEGKRYEFELPVLSIVCFISNDCKSIAITEKYGRLEHAELVVATDKQAKYYASYYGTKDGLVTVCITCNGLNPFNECLLHVDVEIDDRERRHFDYLLQYANNAIDRTEKQEKLRIAKRTTQENIKGMQGCCIEGCKEPAKYCIEWHGVNQYKEKPWLVDEAYACRNMFHLVQASYHEDYGGVPDCIYDYDTSEELPELIKEIERTFRVLGKIGFSNQDME